MPLEIDEILNGRYQIEAILGQGGMGAVYRAHDVNLGVKVAVKENLFITEEYARQFRREATLLASLRHHSLPRVTDHFVLQGVGQYLVMDFIEGEDLKERLERNKIPTQEEALLWFHGVCDALIYLHSRIPPIFHRDIKPGNIKITPEGRAVLVDFGLAKVADGKVSTTGAAKAMTPGFSPPEQYGTGPTDARTDVYALAATMYATLSGKIPEDSLERAMGRKKLTPLREWNIAIHTEIARAIEKALSIPPDERYQTVTEFAAALNAALGSGKTTVLRSSLPAAATVKAGGFSDTATLRSRPEVKPQPQRKWIIPVILVVIAIVVVGGFLLVNSGVISQIAALLESPTATQPSVAMAATETQPVEASPSSLTALPTLTESVQEGVTEEPTAAIELTPTEEPTPAATPIGGGVGQIAFVSDREGIPQIYLINVDGTGLERLTNMQDGACQPAWSSDGNQLLFISPCRDNREYYPGSSIWLLSLDRLEPRQLPTVPGGGDYDPAWSPDSKWIAFASLRDDWSQIYIMAPDGSSLENISKGPAAEYQPVWDPRGTNLLFTTTVGEKSEIKIMSSAGGDKKPFSMGESQGHSHADWSKDGQLVLFERTLSSIPRLVAKRFEDRLKVENQICPESPRVSQPMAEGRWSPDTRWIVFETWPDGANHDIAIMTSNCTNYVELTNDKARDFDPAWRP